MESLFQPTRKSEPTRLVTGRGRMVTVELILPVVLNRMPPWLAALLEPFRKRFEDDSWCPTPWEALMRLAYTNGWRDRWGSVEAQEWFVSSEPIPPDEQPSVYEVAKRLRLDVAMSIEHATFNRHIFAPRGTWGRR